MHIYICADYTFLARHSCLAENLLGCHYFKHKCILALIKYKNHPGCHLSSVIKILAALKKNRLVHIFRLE